MVDFVAQTEEQTLRIVGNIAARGLIKIIDSNRGWCFDHGRWLINEAWNFENEFTIKSLSNNFIFIVLRLTLRWRFFFIRSPEIRLQYGQLRRLRIFIGENSRVKHRLKFHFKSDDAYWKSFIFIKFLCTLFVGGGGKEDEFLYVFAHCQLMASLSDLEKTCWIVIVSKPSIWQIIFDAVDSLQRGSSNETREMRSRKELCQ